MNNVGFVFKKLIINIFRINDLIEGGVYDVVVTAIYPYGIKSNPVSETVSRLFLHAKF